jgi:RNA polymerase sigma-70 factor (ECF subfamily)
VGTVKSRLSRAREKLRSRLIRRGVAPAAWAQYVESTSAAVPAKLIETTVKAAIGYADEVVAPTVALLIQGVVRAMLLKKVSMIAITVVASLALVTSAGVLARQAATLPTGDQPGGQRVEEQARVENQSGNTTRPTSTDLGESKEQEDELIDRIELLRLDVQLLTREVQAREQGIEATNEQMINIRISGRSDANQSQIESLQKILQDLRKEYISKKKELRQKQSELMKGIATKRNQEYAGRTAEPGTKEGTGSEKRGAGRKKEVPIQPAASDAPGISPILEKRLSGIEGKLDNVLKALEDLKREMRQ